MDRLERRLRDDAALIRADLSPELDERIRASLEAAAAAPAPRERMRRTSLFWWTSSLTGLAAALGFVALLNLQPEAADPVQTVAPATVAGSAAEPIEMPALRTRTAVLTAPLEEELDELEADLEKARAVVREDLGLEF